MTAERRDLELSPEEARLALRWRQLELSSEVCLVVGFVFFFALGLVYEFADGWWKYAEIVTLSVACGMSLGTFHMAQMRLTASKLIWNSGQERLALQSKVIEEWKAHWAENPECKAPPPPSAYM